jgi:hypothetical protein
MAEKQKRRAMKDVSEAARGWGEALRGEVEQWPAVRIRRSFGMMLVYREDVVFAALPATKALHSEDAIMLKFQSEPPAVARRIAADRHFAAPSFASARKSKSEGQKWRLFLMREDADVHSAIEWLAEAYQRARKVRS